MLGDLGHICIGPLLLALVVLSLSFLGVYALLVVDELERAANLTEFAITLDLIMVKADLGQLLHLVDLLQEVLEGSDSQVIGVDVVLLAEGKSLLRNVSSLLDLLEDLLELLLLVVSELSG